jgi:predicted ATPase
MSFESRQLSLELKFPTKLSLFTCESWIQATIAFWHSFQSEDLATASMESSTNALGELKDRLSSSTRDGLEHARAEIVEIYQRTKTKQASRASTVHRTELVLIRGLPGTGKERLMEKLLSPLAQQDGGFCMVGKFDQLTQNQKPHAAFVDAFSFLVEMILERGDADFDFGSELAQIEGVELLLKCIPALAKVIPCGANNQKPSFDYRSSGANARDAANRFKHSLRLLFKVIASKHRPLVLILDNIHWADEAAIELLQLFLSDAVNQAVLFLATEREDQNSQLVATMLNKIHAIEVTVTRFHLTNLDLASTERYIADVLEMDMPTTESLSAVVYSTTQGNQYFISVLLQGLLEDGVLEYCHDRDSSTPKWKCDAHQAQIEYGSSLDSAIKYKLRKLPDTVTRMLKYASCLGSSLNIEILGILMKDEAIVTSSLQLAAACGVIVCTNVDLSHWEFSHETVHDAILSLIPVAERESFHLRIGHSLWKHFSVDALDGNIFTVVGQLLEGERLVLDPRERVAIAKLCLRAAEQSIYMSSFETAYFYLTRGISLLGTKCWNGNYSLTLELHNNAIEAAFCIGKFTELYSLVDIVHTNARSFDDGLRSHTAKIFAMGCDGRGRESMKYGIAILAKLGVHFPAKPSILSTIIQLHGLRRKLRRKSSQSLLRIPVLQDENMIVAMQILGQLVLQAFLLEDAIAPLLVIRMVTVSLESGICALSSLGFVLLGAILCG